MQSKNLKLMTVAAMFIIFGIVVFLRVKDPQYYLIKNIFRESSNKITAGQNTQTSPLKAEDNKKAASDPINNASPQTSTESNSKSAQNDSTDESNYECTLDSTKLETMLQPKHIQYMDNPTQSMNAYRKLEEHVNLTNGMKVSIVQGGCEHFAASIVFSPAVDDHSLTDRAFWLAKGAALLQSFSFLKESEMVDDYIAKAALEAIAASAEADNDDANGEVKLSGPCKEDECTNLFSCGDARCSFVFKRIDSKQVEVSAGYDFAL